MAAGLGALDVGGGRRGGVRPRPRFAGIGTRAVALGSQHGACLGGGLETCSGAQQPARRTGDPSLAAAPAVHSPVEVGWANTAAHKPEAREHKGAP